MRLRMSYWRMVLLLKSMQANLEREDSELLQTIDLTAKLEQSLRKLLTKKKSFETEIFACASPKLHSQDSQAHTKLQTLEDENKELYMDNQQLSRELLELKEQLRDCRRQLDTTQKYLAFLQGYNDDLKKEMLFWMKSKRDPPSDTHTVTELMVKIAKLRKENEENERKLISLKDTVEVKPENAHSQPLHQHSLNFDLSKFHNELISRARPRSHTCATCSHSSPCSHTNKNRSKSKSKPKQPKHPSLPWKPRQPSNPINKGKNLRRWHNHYVSASQFPY